MPAPQTLALHLYASGSPLPQGHLGQMRITSVDAGQPGPGGLRLTFDAGLAGGGEDRWLDLRAEAWSTRTGGRRHGAIDLGYDGLPKLGQTNGSTFWTWRLGQRDLEAIEEDRAEALDAPVGFVLAVTGMAVIDGHPWRVTGETTFSLAAAEWRDLLERLGFQVWPTKLDLDGTAVTAHPSWQEAHRRLESARRHLGLGEDEAALAAAFREFERLATDQPYKAGAWLHLGSGVVEAKRRDLRELVAAHAMYLNRLGRHLNPQTGRPGERGEVGVDHWEAQALLSTSQILLAAVLRLALVEAPDA